MAPPLYFLPQTTAAEIAPGGKLARPPLAARGIAAAFSDVGDVQLDCSLTTIAGQGPGRFSGVILCALPMNGTPRRLGYYPAEQTWHPCGDGSQLWIGLDSAEPPTPACLARKRRFPGHRVTLGDGHEWEIPILRAPDGRTSLPRSMGWDAAGEFRMTVKRDYAAAWEAAEKTARLFFESETGGVIEFEEALLLGLQALGFNYRIGRHEQSVLQLIDTTNWEEVLGATVDLPTVKEYVAAEKKRRPSAPSPGSPSCSPGGGGSFPDTGRAAETSTSPA